MSKKIIILIIIFIIPIISLSAQNLDEITLKSGSVIRGSITEIIPEGKVTIDDMAGNTWVFNMSEVQRIAQIDAIKAIKSEPFMQGWVNMTSIGFLAGSNTSAQVAPFSLLSSFGYKNEMGIYAGFASGIEFLNINHIPVMFDLQYIPGNKEVTTVFILRGGYALPTKGESNTYGNLISYDGGIVSSVGLGLKIRTKENFSWDVNLLYRYMQIKYTEENEWSQQYYHHTDIYNRLELRVGFYLD